MASSKTLDQVFTDLGNVLNRIDTAEQQLRVELKQVDGPACGTDLREYQKQMLIKLRAIRDTMQKEGSSLDQLRKERDMARSERDALVRQVDKLTYRIQHLKEHVPVPTPADMKH